MKGLRAFRTANETILYTPVGTGRAVVIEQIKLTVALVLTGCMLLAWETTARMQIKLPLFGFGAAAPSLGLLFAMATGFIHGERVGGIVGLFSGVLADCTSPGGMMLLPLVYFLCGYLSGTVGRRRLAHNLPSFAIFSLCGSGVECLFSILKATVDLCALPPISWIWRGCVPVWILTVLFSPIVYGIVWGEWKIINRHKP